jgi:hypothetical protein
MNYLEESILKRLFFINFLVLVLYRAKQTLRCFLNKERNKLIRTIIYGTDANAISVANALKFETPSDLKLLVLWIKKSKCNKANAGFTHID